MLDLTKSTRVWGIAHPNTPLTGSLWCSDTFVFYDQAEAYCDNVRETGVASDLTPVLLEVMPVVMSDSVAQAYRQEQEEWRARKGQGTLRAA